MDLTELENFVRRDAKTNTWSMHPDLMFRFCYHGGPYENKYVVIYVLYDFTTYLFEDDHPPFGGNPTELPASVREALERIFDHEDFAPDHEYDIHPGAGDLGSNIYFFNYYTGVIRVETANKITYSATRSEREMSALSKAICKWKRL